MNAENTYAILISVERYTADENLHDLPHSFNNVKGLYDALRGDSIGMNRKNILKKNDPENKTELLEMIGSLADMENAENLIIYYAGHGILADDGTHCLALTNSTVSKIKLNGLKVADINDAVGDNKKLNIILILDSCFSESAFDSFKSRNYLILASSARNKTSKYKEGEDYSAFTNELLTILKEGIDSQSNVLTWKDVYSQLKINLKEKGFPAPRISSQNEVDSMEIGTNNFNTGKVQMDVKWIKIIKNDLGKFNPEFKEGVVRKLNTKDPKVEKMLQDHLLDHFPYPIAFYLQKLFIKEATAQDYVKFYESVIRFLYIVKFIEYESLKQTKGYKTGNKFKELMLDFDEPDHDFYFEMLAALSEDFRENKVTSFLADFDFFNPGFQEPINDLEKLRKKKDLEIPDVRTSIMKLVTSLDFLLNYKLVSVKDVKLNYRKYEKQNYDHQISLLQSHLPSKYKVWEDVKEEWSRSFVSNAIAKNNESVLFLYCKDETKIEYLNLWPMIIDMNALISEANNPQIYMYTSKDKDGNYLYQPIPESMEQDPVPLDELEAISPIDDIAKFKEVVEK